MKLFISQSIKIYFSLRYSIELGHGLCQLLPVVNEMHPERSGPPRLRAKVLLQRCEARFTTDSNNLVIHLNRDLTEKPRVRLLLTGCLLQEAAANKLRYYDTPVSKGDPGIIRGT